MAKKRSLIQKLIRLVVMLLILTGFAGALFLSRIDSIAKTAIEESLSFVLQVGVTLDDVNVSLFGRKITLKGLKIANPEGYNTSEAILAEKIEVEVDIKSFSTDQPIIELIHIKNPSITLEQDLKGSNISKLIENASRFSGDEPEGDNGPPKEAGKKFVIKKVIVDKSQVALSTPLLKGKKTSFELSALELTDVGKNSDRPPIAAGLIEFFAAILDASAEAVGGVVPPELREAISGALRGSLSQAQKLLGTVGNLGEKLGDMKENVGKLQDGLKESTESLKKMLPLGDKN